MPLLIFILYLSAPDWFLLLMGIFQRFALLSFFLDCMSSLPHSNIVLGEMSVFHPSYQITVTSNGMMLYYYIYLSLLYIHNIFYVVIFTWRVQVIRNIYVTLPDTF